MDKLLEDSLKLAASTVKAAYEEGLKEGYRQGYLAAITEARKIVNDTFAERLAPKAPNAVAG